MTTKKPTQNLPEFRTRDLALAASLVALQLPIHRVEMDGNRLTFFFTEDTTGGTAQRVEAFWQRQLLIEPQTLVDAYEGVKKQIRERRTN